MLSTNSKLYKLDLGSDNIGKEGSVEIAKILEENYILTSPDLGIYNNEILKRKKKIAKNNGFMKTKCAFNLSKIDKLNL